MLPVKEPPVTPIPIPSIKIYQYAVKVIQGGIKLGDKTTPIGPGIYFTSVNVHNPWRHKVNYAVKLAVSGPHGRPGPISPFQLHQLGPDEATEYDYMDFGNPQSFLESYFVIESEAELDVVGVYTGAAVQDGRLGAMHMERVPARIIPRCKDLRMDISTGVAQWWLTAVPGPPFVVGPAPIATPPCSAWVPATGSAKWVGTSGSNSGAKGDYTYELSFCLCWTFQNAQINLKLWSDNHAKLFFNGSPTTPPATVNNPPFTGSGLAVNITSGFIVGMNKLTVVVTNNEGPTGMLLSGALSANQADCGS
jgi:hypothetical protein